MKCLIVTIAAVLTWSILPVPAVQAQGSPGPTDHHKLLADDVGSWDAELKVWAAGPDADPMVSKATETNRLLEGGMWLVSDFQGEFSGLKFSGHGQFGYDPTKKKYIGTWVDSMNPHLSLMEGTYDAATKTMTMTSEGRDANTGKTMKTKNVGQQLDKNTRLFTMSVLTPDGDEVKIMEIKYTRSELP